MRIIVQRSLQSSVTVGDVVAGKITSGMVLLVGFKKGDTKEDVEYMVHKILHLRIFDDEKGVMNKSIIDSGGSILSISQFTLYGNMERGNRPSYVDAMPSSEAQPLYELFNQSLSKDVPVETGIFGADMKVSICNDGPVTIILESREKYD